MVQLGPLIGLLLVAILLAVTLEVVVKWLIGMGVKRRIAVLILLLVTAGVVATVGLFLLPAIVGQAQTVGEKIPEIRQEILDKLPQGRITQEVERLWAHPDLIVNWKDSLVSVGSFLTKAAYSLGVVITFSFYFLICGFSTFEWVVTFFRPENQRKLRESAVEVSKIISAYVMGQLITSGLAAISIGVVLWFFDVPAPLMLALLAAILDVVPVIGVLILVFAAGLLALSVSAETAVWVCLAIFIYQGIENNLIIPKVYGEKMRLSNLAVLLAISAGGLLAGVIGVILALPAAAAYPPIERIWLKKYLGEDVLEEHQKLGTSGAKNKV